MVSNTRTSDPLAEFSVFSLFPRTFKPSSLPPTSCHENGTDLIVSRLKAMESKSPHRLLEQSKAVLGASSDAMNAEHEIVMNMGKVVSKEPLADSIREIQQGRRPALGRKRAKFSLKPDTSELDDVLEPSIDIEQLQDPEKFFSAFEKLETTKKEILRQRGIPSEELNQNVQLVKERHRRPGLSRKSTTYKHRYSIEPSADDSTILSSQEAFSQNSSIAADDCAQTETMDLTSSRSQRELSGSVVGVNGKATDNRVHLQSDNDEDDGDCDEVIKMLQERFKPVELGMSSLSDLSDIRHSTLKAYGETLQKSRDCISHLRDITNAAIVEASSGDNNILESSLHSLTSPTPAKSPLASLSLLKRRIFQSIAEKDRFSVLDIESSPVRNLPVDQVILQKLKVTRKIMEDTPDVPSAVSDKNGREDPEMPNIDLATRDHAELDNLVVNGVSDKIMEDTPDVPSAENGREDSEIPDIDLQTRDHAELDNVVVNGVSDKIMEDTPDVLSAVPEKNGREDSEMPDIDLETGDHAELYNVVGNGVNDKITEDNPYVPSALPEKIGREDSKMLNIDLETRNCTELDNVVVNGVSDKIMEDTPDVSSNNVGNASDEPREMENQMQEAVESPESDVDNQEFNGLISNQPTEAHADAEVPEKNRLSSSLDRPSKRTRKPSQCKGNQRREAEGERSRPDDSTETAAKIINNAEVTSQAPRRKELRGRQSLAAYGTSLESGLRRSTRIRTRPLEYWKGERPLYGRIHQSLVTVIGTKMFSPGEGQPCLTVKSYVSDEHKELVELAALH